MNAKQMMITWHRQNMPIEQIARNFGVSVDHVKQELGTDVGIKIHAPNVAKIQEKIADLEFKILELESKNMALATKLAESQERKRAAVDDNPLTTRQNTVLNLTARGVPLEEIGRSLCCKRGAVHDYRAAIKRHLRANSMEHAVAIGIKNGWIDV